MDRKGLDDHGHGLGRREVLECMLWAGTGVLWTVAGGVPKSSLMGSAQAAEAGFTFLQISDSHVGFDKKANPNALGTLQEAIAKVKALPNKPAFMLHTGDITHLSKPTEFADDVKGLSASTPIVVFAHIPLWTISRDWGWGTDDSEQALSLLKRFGSVTVLNGHIHQLMQKTEGNVTFHTARSTAFPQPAPGTAPSPGPMVVPAEKLRSVLGIRTVVYTQGQELLAVTDQPLAAS